jgi:hypothetical protein
MTYQSCCDYVRGGKKKATRAKRDTAELLSEIMDSIEHRTEAGINLKSVFRKLEECGLTGAAGFSYADFCEYFREAGGYLGRDIPDAFMFFNDDDGLIAFYYRLAAFLDRESDKAASRKLQ